MTAFWCERAWLTDAPVAGVRVEVEAGRIAAITPAVLARPGDHRLPGLVLPGFADAHSHAFHRALRGRTHGGGGSFWTWREQMYTLAERLDPDSSLALARATYAELALAGVTAVGEFHYLHHGPGGVPYADPNAMGHALIQAAAEAGVRLTLLDTCYLTGGLDAGGHTALDQVQVRFADRDASAWAQRRAGLGGSDRVRIGAAVHSVRAVPAGELTAVAAAATGDPLHVHLSEQVAENEVCKSFYGTSPAGLLAEHGILGPATTAVHGTHLTDGDIALLGTSGTGVCACPSTEADLADGIARFGALRDAGVPLCLGSDQHVQADILGEARLVEYCQRLATGIRGHLRPAELVEMATAAGQRSIGWDDAGRIAPGYRADLVAVTLDSPRTAGSTPAQAVMTAGAPDVYTVVCDGELVVDAGRHVLGDVGALLTRAVEPLWA